MLRAEISADFVAQDAVPRLLDEWLIPPHARGWTRPKSDKLSVLAASPALAGMDHWRTEKLAKFGQFLGESPYTR